MDPQFFDWWSLFVIPCYSSAFGGMFAGPGVVLHCPFLKHKESPRVATLPDPEVGKCERSPTSLDC